MQTEDELTEIVQLVGGGGGGGSGGNAFEAPGLSFRSLSRRTPLGGAPPSSS